jgi:gamma-glutamyltranspeptidase/glutathione hydrolase
MTPTIVREDGRVELVLGSPGGPRIITAVTQVFLRVVAFGEPLEDAVAAPRLHQQWSPRVTRVEREFPELIERDLRSRGHEVERSTGTFASVQAISVSRAGDVVGASDPRRGGAARSDAPSRE